MVSFQSASTAVSPKYVSSASVPASFCVSSSESDGTSSVPCSGSNSTSCISSLGYDGASCVIDTGPDGTSCAPFSGSHGAPYAPFWGPDGTSCGPSSGFDCASRVSCLQSCDVSCCSSSSSCHRAAGPLFFLIHLCTIANTVAAVSGPSIHCTACRFAFICKRAS